MTSPRLGLSALKTKQLESYHEKWLFLHLTYHFPMSTPHVSSPSPFPLPHVSSPPPSPSPFPMCPPPSPSPILPLYPRVLLVEFLATDVSGQAKVSNLQHKPFSNQHISGSQVTVDNLCKTHTHTCTHTHTHSTDMQYNIYRNTLLMYMYSKYTAQQTVMSHPFPHTHTSILTPSHIHSHTITSTLTPSHPHSHIHSHTLTSTHTYPLYPRIHSLIFTFTLTYSHTLSHHTSTLTPLHIHSHTLTHQLSHPHTHQKTASGEEETVCVCV